MGSMIDYAILFTTYYREVRKEYVLEEALPIVMTRATYAILTSSLILVLVTFICGIFMTGTVAAILQTLSIGAFCAIILILFVLPSYLVLLDRFIIKESKEMTMEKSSPEVTLAGKWSLLVKVKVMRPEHLGIRDPVMQHPSGYHS